MKTLFQTAAIMAALLASVPGAARCDELAGEPRPFSPPYPRLQVHRNLAAAVETTVRDAAHVYTSPFRMSRGTALRAAGVIAATGILYAYDREIYDWFGRNGDEDWLSPVLDAGEGIEAVGNMGKANPYWIGGLAVGYALGIDKLTEVMAQVLESYAIWGIFKNGANYLAGRRRPFEREGPRAFEVGGGTSFPSGHAGNVCMLATIVSHHANRRPVTVLAWGLAGAVCLQRVSSDGHWPSDVLVSMAVGTAIAREVIELGEGRRMTIAPAVGSGGSPALAVHVNF